MGAEKMKGRVWVTVVCVFLASCWNENAVRPKANGFPMRIGLVDLMVDIGMN